MKREIATGWQDFESLRMNDRFYVDKTDLLREWWQGGDAVTLITRPRRFGKTLNMSTLNCFFSRKYADRPELFEGLKVWEDPDMRMQNKVPDTLFTAGRVLIAGSMIERESVRTIGETEKRPAE